MIARRSPGSSSKVNHQRQKLLNSLDQIREQKEKVMMTVHDGQEFSQAAMTSLRSYTETLLRHGRDYDIVQQARDIQSRLVSISEISVPAFTWRFHDKTPVKNIMFLWFIQRCFDKISSQNDDVIVADLSMTTDVMDTEVKGGRISDCVVSEIPMVFRNPAYAVIGLVVMNEAVFVVGHHESCLQAYPVTSTHQPQTLSIQELCGPRDMVRFPHGQSQLVICDYYKKQLMWIDVEQCNGVWTVKSER